MSDLENKPATWLVVQLFSLDQADDPMVCRVVLDRSDHLLSRDGVLVAVPGVPVLAGVVIDSASNDQINKVKGQIKATELPIIVQRIPLALSKVRLRVAEGLRYLIRDVGTVPHVDRQVNRLELTGTVVTKPIFEPKNKARFTARFDLQIGTQKQVVCLIHGQLNEPLYRTVNALESGQTVGITGHLGSHQGSHQGSLVVVISQLDVLATGGTNNEKITLYNHIRSNP